MRCQPDSTLVSSMRAKSISTATPSPQTQKNPQERYASLADVARSGEVKTESHRGDRERATGKELEIETQETESDSDRESDRVRETHTQKEKDRETERMIETDRQIETETP